jgi:hypothetical protein
MSCSFPARRITPVPLVYTAGGCGNVSAPGSHPPMAAAIAALGRLVTWPLRAVKPF